MKVLLFSDNTNTEALTWCMSKKTVEYCQSRIQLTKPSPDLQKNTTVELGRDLWRLQSDPLLKQGQLPLKTSRLLPPLSSHEFFPTAK